MTQTGILYASTANASAAGAAALDRAVAQLLQTTPTSADEARPAVLFCAHYQQRAHPQLQTNGTSADADAVSASGRVLPFPPLDTDLVFDDAVLARVRDVWQAIVGAEADGGEFMNFPARGSDGDDDDNNDEDNHGRDGEV